MSSFGIGGTNAHAVLERAPDVDAGRPGVAPDVPLALPISARAPEALRELARRYDALLARDSGPAWVDLAHAAALGRSHHEHRLALVARDREGARAGLAAFLRGEPCEGLTHGRRDPSQRPRDAAEVGRGEYRGRDGARGEVERNHQGLARAARHEAVHHGHITNAEKLRRMVRVHITNQTANRPAGVAMIYEVRPIITQHLRNGLSDEAVAEYAVRRNGFIIERRRFEALFHQVVQAGIDAGEFRDVDVPIVVKTILGANNWVSVWYSEGGRLTGEQIADQIADMFVRALSK